MRYFDILGLDLTVGGDGIRLTVIGVSGGTGSGTSVPVPQGLTVANIHGSSSSALIVEGPTSLSYISGFESRSTLIH